VSLFDPSSARTTPICPTCGGPMQVWPTLDGNGYLAVCPTCPTAPPKPVAPEKLVTSSQLPAQPVTSSGQLPGAIPGAPTGEPQPVNHPPQSRPKDLLAQGSETPPAGAWPESLLEDLPDEARRLLAGDKPAPPKPNPQRMPEELAQSLRDQGFVIAEDAHGVRLGGTANLRSKDTGGLKHHEVVRLAADLDGGIVPPEQRVHCPKCDAVMPKTATRCQWCGAPLTPTADPGS
jgi:hypothetical protein